MLETARRMMVQRYLAGQVQDRQVLQAMMELPRHLFVESALQSRAYHNDALPIGFGQTISQPLIVGLMTQELELEGSERVLEIGTGSGYQAALLAMLVREVYTIERIPQLAERALGILEQLGISNVMVRVSDGTAGTELHADFPATFDRIIVTAGGNRQPTTLLRQLVIGGILLIPIGDSDEQILYKYRRTSKERWERQSLHACSFVKLIGKEGWHNSEEKA